MSRPVRYNASGPLSGSIRGAAVNYVVDGTGLDFGSLPGNWAPMAENAAPIVFVSDSFTLGITTAANAYPMYFACAGTSDEAILDVANKLPLSAGSYTTAAEALEDLRANDLYFVVNQQYPYESNFADNLLWYVDASSYTSYPKSGNTAYDLSGNGNDGTLNNGTTVLSGSRAFDFDGVDDHIRLSSVNQLPDMIGFTCLFNLEDSTSFRSFLGNLTSPDPGNDEKIGFLGGSPNNFFFRAVDNGGSANWNIGYTSANDNKWNFVAFSRTNTNTLQASLNGGSWVGGGVLAGTFNYDSIGANGDGQYFQGKIRDLKLYDRSLSEDQMRQNYYGGPIVTEGLIYMLDAANLVSYASGSTTGYSLTGSNSSSLFNGTAYDTDFSPTFRFDGSDDYIELEDNLLGQIGSGDVPYTLEAWVKVKTLPPGATTSGCSIIGHANQYGIGMQAVNLGSQLYINFGARSNSNFDNNTALDLDTWYHVLCTHVNNSSNKIYINGKLDATGTSLQITNTSAKMQIGWADTRIIGRYGGDIALVRVYNKSFTDDEALQNFQAEQHRFYSNPTVIQDGLLLWLDAGKQDSYPGTGSTWYNLDNTPGGFDFSLLNGIYQSDPRALTFDGVDDTARLPYTSALDTSNMTIEAWIYAEDIQSNTYYEIYRKENGGARILFSFQQNGSILSYGTTTTNNGYSEMDVNINPPDYEKQWVHVVVGYESGLKTMYRNGVILQSDSSQTGNLVAGSATYYIGSLNGTSEFFNGKIAQFRIYNRRLTTAEVEENYNRTKGRFGY